eukprot:CAMPEP_0168558914 /NCGR_PEP_ID=MMETSP0413-20121227/10234_1 /TAXON_ID=136452 /ORGANISM="Filamoeba nolandi, Strain NC-AS-23-1" /LENGTH=387 /DNA_ID=CAMNT_0008590087 /DNA_START=79 /DNA_END=1239 /DNA_ORIENTATION=+
MSTSTIAKQYITKLADTHPNQDLRTAFGQMKDLHEKKLWHQLTLKLENVVGLPYFDKGNELIQLYENFIKDFETKINQFRFVKIILSINRTNADQNEAAAFLQKIADKLSQTEKEATALIISEIAWIRIKQDRLDESKELAEKANTALGTITGADPLVYSSYYRVLAMYHKRKVTPTEFYKASLMYLVYTPLETISLADQQSIAFDMGIAALVSTDIYNFGELLAHPVLQSLQKTPHDWLFHFLFAFNAGDIDKYESLLTKYKADFEAQPALKNNYALLREKISILALMELVFNKTADQRTIAFQELARTTKVPENEVELVVMRALSLKLIKGTIDGVNQTVTITWVQPRVLDMNQIKKMRDRVGEWKQKTQQVLNFVQNETAPELL